MKHDTCLTRLRCRPEALASFAMWRAKLHTQVAAAKGFLSIEILAPHLPHTPEWKIIERFSSVEKAAAWQNSQERKRLLQELTPYVAGTIEEGLIEPRSGGITEVFVTQSAPDKEEEYKCWLAKIHAIEATFDGFQSVYIQSPSTSTAKNWLTLLQFDTKEHLDRWLVSPERKGLLKEAEHLIESLDSHRVISGYSGWFSSLAKGKALPPVWKQTMLVLLVLYPIVMLQLLFLNPRLTWLNWPFATFICNTISVTLISWPMMPIAIRWLGWWLTAEKWPAEILGTLVLLLLYLIEVLLFQNWG